MRKNPRLVQASQLSRMGYCQRKLAYDLKFGEKVTPQQKQARAEGNEAHRVFYASSQQVMANSQRKGGCFIATLALGECQDTRDLRLFRDVVLRKTATGRSVIAIYYRLSRPACTWLATWPTLVACLVPLLRLAASLARFGVKRHVNASREVV